MTTGDDLRACIDRKIRAALSLRYDALFDLVFWGEFQRDYPDDVKELVTAIWNDTYEPPDGTG